MLKKKKKLTHMEAGKHPPRLTADQQLHTISRGGELAGGGAPPGIVLWMTGSGSLVLKSPQNAAPLKRRRSVSHLQPHTHTDASNLPINTQHTLMTALKCKYAKQDSQYCHFLSD